MKLKYRKIGMDCAALLGWNINSTSNKMLEELGQEIVNAENYSQETNKNVVGVYGEYHVYIESDALCFRTGRGYLYSDGLYLENGEPVYYLTIPRHLDEEEFVKEVKINGGYI